MADTFDFGDIVLGQSVGPYTDEINDENPPPWRRIFQPKQGRDLTVLYPEENNGKTTIELHMGTDISHTVTVSSAVGSDIIITDTIPQQMFGTQGTYDLEITTNTPPVV